MAEGSGFELSVPLSKLTDDNFQTTSETQPTKKDQARSHSNGRPASLGHMQIEPYRASARHIGGSARLREVVLHTASKPSLCSVCPFCPALRSVRARGNSRNIPARFSISRSFARRVQSRSSRPTCAGRSLMRSTRRRANLLPTSAGNSQSIPKTRLT
jgi:hypothetical protein